MVHDDTGGPTLSKEDEIPDLQKMLQRNSSLPQATITKVEGFGLGGGHEFMLACDMRFVERGKAKFMQMEVGMVTGSAEPRTYSHARFGLNSEVSVVDCKVAFGTKV